MNINIRSQLSILLQGYHPLRDTFLNSHATYYFIGQFLSLTGTWTQRVAEAWLAWQLTGSAFMLGLVSFLTLFPGIFTNLFAGVWIDHTNKKKFVQWLQFLLLLLAFGLFFLVVTNQLTIEILLVFCTLQALIAGADIPARQAFLAELVSKEQLPQAISINSIMTNLGRILGPAVAGILIPLAGESSAFALNGCSYVFMFFAIKNTAWKSETRKLMTGKMVENILTGFRFVRQHPTLPYFLLLFAMTNFFGMFYSSQLPLFADGKFKGGATALSMMFSSTGVGAFCGALYLGAKVNRHNIRKHLTIASMILGLALIGLVFSPYLWMACFCLMVGGFAMMLSIAGTLTLTQLETPSEFRGRMISFYTLTFTASSPIGNLWAGWLTENFHIAVPFVSGGLFIFIVGWIFYRKKELISIV